VEDMCYDIRRAEACVDESAHHALANAGGREIVGKKEGEQKGSARGSVQWGCYYATALDIEVDPQRCCLGSCQSDFALQAVVECRALEPECFRVDEPLTECLQATRSPSTKTNTQSLLAAYTFPLRHPPPHPSPALPAL
jgi:hypothetical protein